MSGDSPWASPTPPPGPPGGSRGPVGPPPSSRQPSGPPPSGRPPSGPVGDPPDGAPGFQGPGPTDPWALVAAPPPSRRRVVLLVVAVVTAVAVLGATVATGLVLAVRSGPVGEGPDVPGGGRGAVPSVEEVVPEITRFVEAERGLEFATPPEVRLLPDDEFEAALDRAEDRDADPERLARAQATYTALGLVPPGTDLQAELDALLAAGVVGFYDPRTDELYVRGDDATPAVRSTIVHELVHALQDQVFDLDRPEYDDRDDELPLGFMTVVEGDASLVQQAYEEQEMTAAERRAARQPPGDVGPLLEAPPALLASLTFPYVVGPDFVTAVRKARGQAGLDALFGDPPATSEQLLHPEDFLAGEPPLEVPPPAADGEVLDSGVLGEAGLALVLAQDVLSAPTSPATEGWGGDAYVTWRDGSGTCTRATVVTDTPTDAAELRDALSELEAEAGADDRVEVVGSGPLTFTSCRGGQAV